MSTGADCRIYEDKMGWHYKLQDYPYGETPSYAHYGTFRTFREATDHLFDNHANPGGYSVKALPGCKHDLQRRTSLGDTMCDRCGEYLGRKELNDE